MRKYKGYYIDGVIFKNEKEIDTFYKECALDRFKLLNAIWQKDMSYESSMALSEHEQYMHDSLGFTYEELERLETA